MKLTGRKDAMGKLLDEHAASRGCLDRHVMEAWS